MWQGLQRSIWRSLYLVLVKAIAAYGVGLVPWQPIMESERKLGGQLCMLVPPLPPLGGEIGPLSL